jgi:hypothetical protein
MHPSCSDDIGAKRPRNSRRSQPAGAGGGKPCPTDCSTRGGRFRTLLLIILSVIVSVIVAGCAAPRTTSDAHRLEDLAGQASLIFRGTVVKPEASSVRAVPQGPDTAVVRVDEVLRGDETLAGFIGREVTVQLRVAAPASLDQRAVFFANPEVFGEGLAVREVGRLAIEQAGADLGKRLDEAARRRADQALLDRLARASAVAVGVVSGVGPLAPPSPLGSEHDPDWWRAVLRVEAVVKGKLPSQEVVVHFAHSRDIVWFRSPKLREGQRAVFLLQRTEAAGLPAGGYVLLDPLDLQPVEQQPRIERLIQSSR